DPESGAGVEHLAELALDEPGGWDGTDGPSGRRGLDGVGRDDRGGHAATPSRWVSAVSDKNMSSRPAPSADRSSVRAMPAVRAKAPTRAGSASVRTQPSLAS